MRQSKGDGNCAKVSAGERYRGRHHHVEIEPHRNWLWPPAEMGRELRRGNGAWRFFVSSINLLSRILHVLERCEHLAGDPACVLHHLTDVDVLYRIVRGGIDPEPSAAGVEPHP